MFGEHRYSDTNGNALPDEVWATLTAEEDLTVALGAEQEQREQEQEEQEEQPERAEEDHEYVHRQPT